MTFKCPLCGYTRGDKRLSVKDEICWRCLAAIEMRDKKKAAAVVKAENN